jgi:enamine deaminase RidA (YjgF/YER057c/UK114 family)
VFHAPGGRAGTLESRVTRRLINSGSTFEEQIGYSRAVVQGEWIFVSGTTGFNYSTMTIADDVVEQVVQCLRNIELALIQADACMADIIRVTYVLPDPADFPKCWPTLRDAFGMTRPAAIDDFRRPRRSSHAH